MSDALKVLMDDHRKVNDLFKQFEGSADRELALKICSELTIHAILEEEIVYPVLRDEVDPGIADEGEEEHREMKELIATAEQLEHGDPELTVTMTRLQHAVRHHVDEEEAEAFPKLEAKTSEDLYEMGNELFRRRQELMREREQLAR